MANFTIKQMSPQLQTTDLERSISFYTDTLGFEVEFRFEDFYAGIMKDRNFIHLKLTDNVKIQEPHTDESPLAITFSVDNIEGLYHELSANAVAFIQPLRQMPYGKEFYLADPDGNVISFLETAN